MPWQIFGRPKKSHESTTSRGGVSIDIGYSYPNRHTGYTAAGDKKARGQGYHRHSYAHNPDRSYRSHYTKTQKPAGHQLTEISDSQKSRRKSNMHIADRTIPTTPESETSQSRDESLSASNEAAIESPKAGASATPDTPESPTSGAAGSTTTEDVCQDCESLTWRQGICRLCKAFDEIDALREKLREGESMYLKTIDTLNRKETRMQQLMHDLHARDPWIRGLEATQESLKSECDNLAEKLQKSEFEIAKLQRTELAKLHRDEALLDDTAKTNLNNFVRTKVQAISRPYFRRVSWSGSARKYPNLNGILPGIFASRWTKGHWPLIRDHPEFCTRFLIDAVLFGIVTTKFFKNPFFQAERDLGFKEMLDKVYSEGREKKLDTVECWRKNTVNLLKEFSLSTSNDPSFPGPAHGDLVPHPVSRPVLREISSEISTLLYNFLDLHDAIPEPETPSLEDKIYDLVSASANLAEDWHSREFYFSVIDMDWLEAQGIGSDPERALNYVIPKNKILEENFNYTIVAVLSPGFIRYEKGDKPGSEVEIIWEKASVLLGKVEGLDLGASTLQDGNLIDIS
ncbi:hypothetical protein TWF281_006577 [Arthrobotrys megalospora]